MLISLRLYPELLAEIDAIAKAERRSRNQVIIMRLETGSVAQLDRAPAVGLGEAGSIPALPTKPGSRTATGIERMLDSKRSTHDPKTCRIYKCGMCASLKGDKQ